MSSYSNAFIHILTESGKSSLQLRLVKGVRFLVKVFPLSKKGSVNLAKELYESGVDFWSYSAELSYFCVLRSRFSPIDCIEQERDRLYKIEEKPRRSLVAKMLKMASKPSFVETLTDDEKKALLKLKRRLKESS